MSLPLHEAIKQGETLARVRYHADYFRNLADCHYVHQIATRHEITTRINKLIEAVNDLQLAD